MFASIGSTRVKVSTISIFATNSGFITGAFFIVSRINGEILTTEITVATINGTVITIIARNLDVHTTRVGITIIYSTGVVIITADRCKVTSAIFTT